MKQNKFHSDSISLPPRHIWIELTNRCNMHPPCVMCHWSRASAISSGEEISPKILDELVKMQPYLKTVYPFIGGEPLMYSGFFPFLARILPHVWVEFNTNGALLTNEAIERIIDLKVNLINVSLDAATRLTYEKIRRNNFFDRIISNLKLISEQKSQKQSAHPFLCINMTLMKENLSEMVDFVKLGKTVGVQAVVFNLLNKIEKNIVVDHGSFHFDYEAQAIDTSEPRFKSTVKEAKALADNYGIEFRTWHQDILKVIASDVKAATQVQLPSRSSAYFCEMPWESAMFHVEGDVRFCCYMDWEEGILGNLNQNSFEEIWNGEKAQNIRNEIINGRFPSPCRNCTVRISRAAVATSYPYLAQIDLLEKYQNGVVEGKEIFKLKIKNTGTHPWIMKSDESACMRVIGFIYNRAGRFINGAFAPAIELRRDLPRDIQPGEEFVCDFPIDSSWLDKEKYFIKFEMIYEHHFLFSDLNSQPLFVNL